MNFILCEVLFIHMQIEYCSITLNGFKASYVFKLISEKLFLMLDLNSKCIMVRLNRKWDFIIYFGINNKWIF